MLYELKNLRKASGFTQASMAEKLGDPIGNKEYMLHRT